MQKMIMESFFSKQKVILLIFSVVFFVLYNFLNFTILKQFNSPDEMANFVFTEQVIDYSRLRFPLDKSQYEDLVEFIHPRSTFVEEGIGSDILPVGFWGLPLIYGLVGKIVGLVAILYITPLLTILMIWSFYGIVKKVFDEHIAFWSAILLFFQPVLWYYSARSLFPNVPFIALLLIGTWFLVNRPWRLNWFNDVVGMMLFMLGVLIRPNEIVWVALCALIVVLWYRKNIPLHRLLVWIIVGLLFIALYGIINHQLYGSSAGSYISSRSVQLPAWYSYIFPFGINILIVVKTVWFFMVKLLWWYIVPSAIGFIFWIYDWFKNKLSQEKKVYGIVFIVMSLFLIFYYGSQVDNLFALKTVGVAYTRYWLPIYIGMLPFIVYGFSKIANLFQNKRIWNVAGFVTVAFFAVLSAQLVFGGIDGLLATKDNLIHGREIKTWVLAHTDSDVILVTDYEDKFFWPERQVMVKFFNPRIGVAIAELTKEGHEVYYFGVKLEGESEKKVLEYIAQFGLTIDSVKNFDGHELYKFEQSKQ